MKNWLFVLVFILSCSVVEALNPVPIKKSEGEMGGEYNGTSNSSQVSSSGMTDSSSQGVGGAPEPPPEPMDAGIPFPVPTCTVLSTDECCEAQPSPDGGEVKVCWPPPLLTQCQGLLPLMSTCASEVYFTCLRKQVYEYRCISDLCIELTQADPHTDTCVSSDLKGMCQIMGSVCAADEIEYWFAESYLYLRLLKAESQMSAYTCWMGKPATYQCWARFTECMPY